MSFSNFLLVGIDVVSFGFKVEVIFWAASRDEDSILALIPISCFSYTAIVSAIC